MTSKRLNGLSLSLTIDSKEHMSDIASYTITDEERDEGTRTFGDGAAGGQPKLTVETIQSLAAESLHQIVWDHPGRTDVPFKLAPAGNKAATAEEPHFTGTLDFPTLRPELGMEAGARDATTSIEFTIQTIEKVTA